MPTQAKANKHITLWQLADVLWLLALTLYIVAGAPLLPLHGDESTHLFMARDYYDWRSDPAHLIFREWETLDGDDATRQDLRLKDGVVARLLFGFVAEVGGYTANDLNNQWAWGSGWDYNHANGHVPADDLLLRARVASSLALAASVVALFAIGAQLGGRSVAYSASLIYALNPAVLINGRRAMQESTMLLFILLLILAALHLLKHRHWWQFALVGGLSGLAVASKHTSAVAVAAVFVACGSYWLWLAIRSEKAKLDALRPIGSLFIAGIFSLGVFYALNPAWWGDPITRAAQVLETRTDFIDAQLSAFGGYQTIGAQVAGFLENSFSVPRIHAETTLDSFIDKQQARITAYDNSILAGYAFPFVLPLLLLIGLGTFMQSQHIAATSRWLIGLWAISMLLLTLLTPLNWQRYYLPIYPVIALFAGFGLRALMLRLQSSSGSDDKIL